MLVLDVLFYNIGNFVSEHLKVIQADLINIDPLNFEENIKQIIKRHHEIINFTRDFNEIYSPLIGLKFLSIAISFGVVGFILMMVNLRVSKATLIQLLLFQIHDFNTKMTYIFFLLSILFGLLIYSVVGTKITTEVS